MTRIKTATVASLAALALSLCAFAQSDPDAAKRQAELKAKEAEKHARKMEAKAGEIEKKIKEVEVKLRLLGERPRLGLLVNTDKDSKTDSQGALLSGVTPGGPAEEAGVKAGDIIVKMNGISLAGPNTEADEDESAPSIKLLSLAKNLKAGEKVTLEVLRGKEIKTFTLEPRAMGSQTWVFKDMDIPGVDWEGMDIDIPNIEIPDIPELLMLHGGGLDMELVTLNPELGEYFGASEGLLVVSVPKAGSLPMRGGDVLLKIGDRAPKNPAQAMRIFNSYEAGETVNVEVLRKQKKQALNFKMPEQEDRKVRRHSRIRVPGGEDDEVLISIGEDGEETPLPPQPPVPTAPPAKQRV